MSNMYDGFNDLMEEVKKYIANVENSEDIIEIEVKEFVKDLKKLTKPISQIHKSGYTHLIHTFSYRKKEKEFEVGWGKYYGPMVENGTKNMSARTHLRPCFEKNKEKYYSKIYEKIFG